MSVNYIGVLLGIAISLIVFGLIAMAGIHWLIFPIPFIGFAMFIWVLSLDWKKLDRKTEKGGE